MNNKIHQMSHLIDGIIFWLRNNTATKLPKAEMDRAKIVLESLLQQRILSDEENETLMPQKYIKVNYQFENIKLEEKIQKLSDKIRELELKNATLRQQISYKKENLIKEVKLLKSQIKCYQSDVFKRFAKMNK